MKSNETVIKIDDKYTVIEDINNGIFKATRYGEEWRDLIGDNLILAMFWKLELYELALKEIVEKENRHPGAYNLSVIAKQALEALE